MDLPEAVKIELKKQKKSVYWLANSVEMTTANTIYRWLRGEQDISSTKVGEVLDLLGLEIKRRRNKSNRG